MKTKNSKLNSVNKELEELIIFEKDRLIENAMTNEATDPILKKRLNILFGSQQAKKYLEDYKRKIVKTKKKKRFYFNLKALSERSDNHQPSCLSQKSKIFEKNAFFKPSINKEAQHQALSFISRVKTSFQKERLPLNFKTPFFI